MPVRPRSVSLIMFCVSSLRLVESPDEKFPVAGTSGELLEACSVVWADGAGDCAGDCAGGVVGFCFFFFAGCGGGAGVVVVWAGGSGFLSGSEITGGGRLAGAVSGD